MSSSARIKTPLKQHLLRFRLGALPLIAFFGSVFLTLWLWERQANTGTVVGEIAAQQVEVPLAVSGTLISPDGNYWQLFDSVQKGQVIARLDDKHLQAQLKTIDAETQRLIAEIEAARANLELDRLGITQDGQREYVQLQFELADRRLDLVRQLAVANEAKAELKSLEARLQQLSPIQGFVDATQVNELRTTRDVVKARIDAANAVVKEIQSQGAELKSRVENYERVEIPDVVERILAPIRASIQAQESRMHEVALQLEDLVVVAPTDGVITAIHHLPGQYVTAGTSILTISRPDSSYVISYVRERQMSGLYEGMNVALRLRNDPAAQEYTSTVETIGPQVQPVPPKQLIDQASPEWATPVKIPIPPELRQKSIRPGQMVQVIFRGQRRID